VAPVFVVGAGLHDPRPAESAAREPYRLVLVAVSQMALESLLAMLSCARRASRRARTWRLLCAQELKLLASVNHEKLGRDASEPSSISVCDRLLSMLLSACGTPHGQPSDGSEPVAPDQILEFGTLYGQNCSGCHGANGKGGPAIALADPLGAIIGMVTGRDDPTGRLAALGPRGLERVPFGERGNERREPAPSDWSQVEPRPASCRKAPQAPWRKRAPWQAHRPPPRAARDPLRCASTRSPSRGASLARTWSSAIESGPARDGHQHDVSAGEQTSSRIVRIDELE